MYPTGQVTVSPPSPQTACAGCGETATSMTATITKETAADNMIFFINKIK
jgi:hypothetical protein